MNYSNKNKVEMVFLGRGGQGIKTSAEIIAQAVSSKGKYIQAFPEFGPERSGAPVRSFLRISDHPIRTHEPITNPDYLIIMDDSLVDSSAVKELKNVQLIILNSKKEPGDFRELKRKARKLITIDASGISKRIVGENRPNTVILGKLVFVSDVVSLEKLQEVFERIFSSKLKKEKLAKNLKAIEEAYDI